MSIGRGSPIRSRGKPRWCKMDDLRSTPRMTFPADLTATALLPSGTHYILDCAPQGLRVALAGAESRPRVGERIAGAARLGPGPEIPFVATVVWTTSREMGLELEPPGIPARVIDSNLVRLARQV